MGVYIPTWKKPDDCLQCPFHRSYEDGTISCELPKSSCDDCKMVDVKAPHGRLIDYHEVRTRMIGLSFSVQNWISEVELSNVPTVIEREG